MKFSRLFKNKVLKTMAVASVIAGIVAPNTIGAFELPSNTSLTYKVIAGNVVSDDDAKYAPTYYNSGHYHENDPLGAATHFHVFANSDVQINAHTNGNIATKFMTIANSNSGTNNLVGLEMRESSYVKDFKAINSQIICNTNSPLIVGPDVEIGLYDNNNGYTLKGSRMAYWVDINNRIKNLYQEAPFGAEYINIDREFKNLRNISKSLSKVKATTEGVEFDFRDMNRREIKVDMTNNPCTVVDLAATQLVMGTPICIAGYDKEGKNSLIINVDLKGYADDGFDINSKTFLKTVDGNSINTQERTSWEYGKVLWNFYDSSASDGCFKGKIDVSAAFMGSVLAPNANVIFHQNFDGTAAVNVFVNRAETHRNDFLGNMPVIKSDSDTTSTTETTTETTTTTTTETTTTTTTETTTTTTTETTTTTTTETTTTTTTESTTESTTKATTTETTTVKPATTTETTTEATTNTTETTTHKHSVGPGSDDKTTTESTTKATTTEPTTEATTKVVTTEATTKAVTTEPTTEATTKAAVTESTTKDNTTETTTGPEPYVTTTEKPESTETTTEPTTETTTKKTEITTEDVTTSGQATEVTTDVETTTEVTTTTTTTETTTKPHGIGVDDDHKVTTTEPTTEVTTVENTELTTSEATETTTKRGGSSSSTSDDNDKNNQSDEFAETTTIGGGDSSSAENTETTTSDGDAVNTTVDEAATETTTKRGDSTSGGSGSRRPATGGGSSDKAEEKTEKSSTETATEAESEVTTVDEVTTSSYSEDIVTETTTKSEALVELTTTTDDGLTGVTDGEDIVVIGGGDASTDVSVTDGSDAQTADSASSQTSANGEKLPQTGSIVNTKALCTAGAGMLAVGLFLVIKSKKKSA